jgi:hypothetical protein
MVHFRKGKTTFCATSVVTKANDWASTLWTEFIITHHNLLVTAEPMDGV